MNNTPYCIFSGAQVKRMRKAWHFGRVRRKKITCRSFVGEPAAKRLSGRPMRRRKCRVTNYLKKYSERERGGVSPSTFLFRC
jgi:hypothetical protein